MRVQLRTHFMTFERVVGETGDLKWVVRDWDGNPLAEGDRRVTVPAGGERLAVEVPAGPFPERLKFAEAEFSVATVYVQDHSRL